MLSLFTNQMDYSKIPIPRKLLELPYPREAIRELIMRRCERAVSFEEVDGPACQSDIVILTAFNQGEKLHVNIGKGADPELEALCLGRKKGDCFIAFGKEEKNFQLSSIVRRNIPELSDDIMSVIEPGSEISAEDYRKELTDSVTEKSIIKSAAAVFNIIINQAVRQDAFLINEQELDDLKTEYYDLFKDYGAQQKLTAEEAIQNAMKNQDKEQTPMEYLHEMALKELKKASVCNTMLGNPPGPVEKGIKLAELVPGLQDEFYQVIYEYTASKIEWKEDPNHAES